MPTPYPIVANLIETFGDWLQHRREMSELQSFDPGELGRIAQELGVSSDDLQTLVRQGPHSADELPKMLAALGIDSAALERAQPLVFHDMQRVCAGCGQKARCQHDLAAGGSARHYEEYCANAPTIDALAPTAS